MSRVAHGSSGIVVIVIAALLGAGAATAATAPVRWTEAKAEARIDRGTYRVVNKGEVFWANNSVVSHGAFVANVEAICKAHGNCPLPHVWAIILANQARYEAELAQAKAGHALKDTDCKGTFGRKRNTYKKFKCEAVIADADTTKSKVYRTKKAYTLHLEVAPATKQGFIVRGLVLHA